MRNELAESGNVRNHWLTYSWESRSKQRIKWTTEGAVKGFFFSRVFRDASAALLLRAVFAAC